MTFGELQTATQFGRFKDSTLPSIKIWLNTRMGRIWTAFEWSFKIAEPTIVTTLAGNRYLGPATAATVMPADFGTVRNVYTEAGDDLLTQLEEHEFNATYLAGRIAGTRGTPEAFTVVNRKVILGPLPDRVYSLPIGYRRLLCHLDAANGNIVAGVMAANSDVPVWPEEYHEALVVGAQALGLKLLSDPDWIALEAQHDDIVAGMIGDGLLHDELARPRQYARDPL